MKMRHIQAIRLLVLAKLCAAMLSSTEDVFSGLSELTDLCPYTSFCNQNASTRYPYSEDYKPCCQSCSCDPDCGLHGNCCFSQLDKFYTENEQAIVCRSAFVVEPSEEELPDAYLYRYRMINVCRNIDYESDMNATSCEHLPSDAAEAFHPVVSRKTSFIYTNALCALCNNVSDAEPWRRAVTCSPNAETILSDTLESFMSGKQSTVLSGCHVYYTPPSGFDLSPADSCNPFVTRTCDKDFTEDEHNDRYRKLCKMFNATFTVRWGIMESSYSNIYCFLCNIDTSRPNRPEIQNKQCLKSGLFYNYKYISGFRLTVLLNITRIYQNQVPKDGDARNDCPINSVSVTSSKKECRKVRCPWGQILLNNRCRYYSKMWVGGPFSVMLRLTPVNENELIPSSFFRDMPDLYKNDRQALWINRKTFRRWKFLVLYHFYQDKPAIEYIVVKATYPSMSVNPQHLRKMIKEALSDTWQMYHKNSSFDLMVDFNEYLKYAILYNDTLWEMGVKVNTTGCLPLWTFCPELASVKTQYKELLCPVSPYSQKEIDMGIPITKVFLCNQVDLLPDEYDYECGTVFFRVKNVTLYTFGVINSTTSELIKPSVRVCLHGFEHTYNSSSDKPFQFVLLHDCILS